MTDWLMLSEAKRPVGSWHPERPVRLDRHSFDHLGRCLQNQICRALDLIEPPHNPEAETHELVNLGTPVANSQSFKTQNSYSNRDTRGYRRSDRLRERDRHTTKRLPPLKYGERAGGLKPERFSRVQPCEISHRPTRGRCKLIAHFFDHVDRSRRTRRASIAVLASPNNWW
ncbi:hypothetical protein EN873_15875 [bacterium M00.F.Ca.ET.230.01.1.1]|nr:hypothetical protein EN873_15875 [bacterium M00.F.Ca.ET.230.01.1.1]